MTPRDFEVIFAAPVFMFLGIVLFVFFFGSLIEALSLTPNHLLTSCILFVLCFNAFRISVKMIRK